MGKWRSCGVRRFTPTSCPPWTCGSKVSAKYRLGARRKSSTPRTDTAMAAHATRKRRVGGSTRVVVVSLESDSVYAYMSYSCHHFCFIIIINNNNNFIVQFIEWKYILQFEGCIKTQYLSHVVTHAYSKIKHVNM